MGPARFELTAFRFLERFWEVFDETFPKKFLSVERSTNSGNPWRTKSFRLSYGPDYGITSTDHFLKM
jgi:hypothetical protein